MNIWNEDESGAIWLTNLQHPIIREEYSKRLRELGLIRYNDTLNEQQRRDFDRAMVQKYGDQYPPPGRTPWLLKIWDMLEQPRTKKSV